MRLKKIKGTFWAKTELRKITSSALFRKYIIPNYDLFTCIVFILILLLNHPKKWFTVETEVFTHSK